MYKLEELNKEIRSSKYIACIYEGNAEKEILELLLENSKLKFSSDKLLEGELIRVRAAKEFEQRYLRKGFTEQILIIRVLDSRGEKFKLSKAYQNKIKVENIITAPEIEMLVILNEGRYEQYKKVNKKTKKKPSDYCKDDLRMKNVKASGFIKNYFSDVNKLIQAIKKYNKVSNIQKGEYTLYDLLL